MNYKTCWITLNRECNLRCKWCYAQNTNYLKNSDMTFEKVIRIVDLCAELNIKHITLIGGEPTLYSDLQNVIKYIHSKKINCGFVTNGVKFKDEAYIKELSNCGIKQLSVSMKGEDKNAFKLVTGENLFDDVIVGIENCLKHGIALTVSMVLTDDNIDTYLKGIRFLKSIGVEKFRFSFCYEYNTNEKTTRHMKNHNPKKIINKFVESYGELDTITNHKFNLFQSYPLCLWDEKIIKKMCEKGQISTVCQLLKRSGLIFDTDGYIIPCNAMPDLKLGRLGYDFNNAKELIEYVNSPEIINVYNKLCGVPDRHCLSCKDLVNCGGGCVCQWTNYSYNNLFKMEE